MLQPSTLALSYTSVRPPSTMALCHLKLCGCVKAHVRAINKFAWPVTHSWVLISSTDLQRPVICFSCSARVTSEVTMAAKTPAAKKRKIVQENRIQGRFQALHLAFWCGCGVCPVRSADGARWSAVLRWTKVTLCCCRSCTFLEEAYSPNQAFSWAGG